MKILCATFFLVGLWGLSAEEVTNPDGTKNSSQTIGDLAREKEKKEASDLSKRDPRDISKANAAKFPEEEKKKRLQDLERAKMTAEEKDRQKRMLDKSSVGDKKINAQLKERKSFPNRYGP